MAVDLLSVRDHEPPMGDLGLRATLAFNRALWTEPIEGEEGAPPHRIIHARVLQLHEPTHLHRLGVCRAPGYHKCGSHQDLDWVEAFRMRVWTGDAWQVVRSEQGLDRTEPETVQWFDLDDLETSAVILEVRRCGIDTWWTPWNLTKEAFVLKAEAPDLAPRRENNLEIGEVALNALPGGLSATMQDGEVRFRSDCLDVGFCLNRTGFSHFSIDETGQGRTKRNLLRQQPGVFYQGSQLHPVGQAPVAAPLLRYDADGVTRVEGNRVTYDVTLSGTGQRYRLAWEVRPDGLSLHAERHGERPVRAWHSSAWMMSFDSTTAPAHMLGSIARTGETGQVTTPAWLHVPRFGSLRLDADADALALRANVYRPFDMTTTEVKLGEEPQPEGDYLLPAGRHTADLQMTLAQPVMPARDEAPEEVAQALRRCSFTALTYRPDTATLSNNGVSIHCPICMDSWAAVTTRMGLILPDLEATYFLRDSLGRWLDGGPGYASGMLLQDGERHPAEDEYLMTGTAALLGLATYLQHAGTPGWLADHHQAIRGRLDRMRARDLDDDGLVESRYRTGVSGTGQWSTCWLDVLSFGWKDAFANALLYPALVQLADILPALDAPDLALGLSDWAERLRGSYKPAFFNPETGWLAGWRCAEDELHDYAFLPVNGAAVCGGLLDGETARTAIEGLWDEAQRVDLPDPVLGLPANLWPVPDEDRSDIMQGYPMGYYQNGGRTQSQTRHFVGALYRVGMDDEADHMLQRLCKGLADGRVYGGSKSGVDWRSWDGRPCGYEGLLTDQFGVLAMALERYGALPEARKNI